MLSSHAEEMQECVNSGVVCVGKGCTSGASVELGAQNPARMGKVSVSENSVG